MADDSDLFILLKDIQKKISELESRLVSLESQSSQISTVQFEPLKIKEPVLEESQKADQLEIKIGQYWLAKLGIIAFTFGIVFLMILPLEEFPPVFPSLTGFVISSVMIAFSYLSRGKHSYISTHLLTAGLITIFISVMRLHFFTPNEFIENYFVEVILLLIVTAGTLVIAIRNDSVILTVLGFVFISTSSLISDQSILIFFLLIMIAVFSVTLRLLKQWLAPLILGIVLTNLTHLIWYFNNPFVGNEISFVIEKEFNLLFLIIYLIIFSIANFKLEPENYFDGVVSFLNSFFFVGIFTVISFTSRSSWIYSLIAAIALIILSSIHFMKNKSKYSTFFYSMSGYILLTIMFFELLPRPQSDLLLCWQSLLVLSTAVWYRSNFIVITNFIIFLGLLLIQLFTLNDSGFILINFGLVALISAQILNKQKERLELSTELMQNSYLLSALFIIPFSVHTIAPSGYSVFAWIGIALLYYLLGIIFKVNTYRWMALATLCLTAGYVFVIGIMNKNTSYKILSFLSVGIVLIVVSIIYSKRKNNISDSKSKN